MRFQVPWLAMRSRRESTQEREKQKAKTYVDYGLTPRKKLDLGEALNRCLLCVIQIDVLYRAACLRHLEFD